MGVKADQHFAVDGIEQRRLVPEMPVKRRLLHTEPLGQLARRQLVDAHLVEKHHGLIDNPVPVNRHQTLLTYHR